MATMVTELARQPHSGAHAESQSPSSSASARTSSAPSRIIHLLKARDDIDFTFCVVRPALLRQAQGRLHPRARPAGARRRAGRCTGDTDAEVVGLVIASDLSAALRSEQAGRRRLPRRHEHRHGLHRRGAAQRARSCTSRAACAPTTGACPRRSTARSSTTSSDRIYTYFHEYKQQGVTRGPEPAQHRRHHRTSSSTCWTAYYYDRIDEYEALRERRVLRRRAGSSATSYFFMTCHRRENVEDPVPLQAHPRSHARSPIRRSTSRRATARRSASTEFGLDAARATRSWSTRSATASCSRCWSTRAARSPTPARSSRRPRCCSVPSLQMRKATERPQVYDCGRA